MDSTSMIRVISAVVAVVILAFIIQRRRTRVK